MDIRNYITSIRSLLYLALVLALLASLGHVAYAFATVNDGSMITGYMSAVAIDIGLLALAAGINVRRANDRPVRWLWVGVVLFSIISVYANWLAGISHLTPIAADVGSFGRWLESLRPILLSGVLPLLVIYLSEIVSSDYQNDQEVAARQAQKEARAAKRGASDTSRVIPTEQSIEQRKVHLLDANETRQTQIDQRRARVRRLLSEGMSQGAIADEIGVSMATVKRDAKSLKPAESEIIVNVNGGSK